MYIWINTQKISLFDGFVLEIWLIKKSCNLTGWEQSGPYLRKQNFPKYGICGRTKHELLGHSLFIIEQIKWKSIARFFNKFKKPCFWPISPIWGAKYISPNFTWVSSTVPKFRKRKRPNRLKDERTDGFQKAYFKQVLHTIVVTLS